MKLHTETAILEQQGLSAHSQFKINTQSSKLFDILQNSLYTDKILAPVREYLCNALDAHKDANVTIPFKVYTPNANVPEWAVRDFGKGLSPDEINNLFSTYLLSSKDDSDDLIGGFGIGSKSAFAYTDQFTVISYHGGTCSRYVCYIDENRMPQVSLVDRNDTNEPTGLSVRVPVREEHMQQFRAKTAEILQFFPEDSYECSGTSCQPHKYTKQTADFGLVEDQWISSGATRAFVLMGNVRYAIPENFRVANSVLEQLTRSRIVTLFAPIGACSLNPSRETLSLDRRTETWLTTKCQKIYDELTHTLQQELDTTTNAIEYARAILAFVAENPSAFLPSIDNNPAYPNTFDGNWNLHHARLGLDAYQVKGPKGGPPRKLNGDEPYIQAAAPICLAPKDKKTNKALLAARHDIIAFHKDKPGARYMYGRRVPNVIVVTPEQCTALNITPDIDLNDYAVSTGSKTAPVRYVREFGQKGRSRLDDMPDDKVAYYVKGSSLDTRCVHELTNTHYGLLRYTKSSDKDYRVFEVPAKYVQFISAITLDELLDIRLEEIARNADEIKRMFISQSLSTIGVSHDFVTNILGITGLPDATNISYWDPRKIEQHVTTPQIVDALKALRDEVDAENESILEEIRQKIADNKVVYKLLSAHQYDQDIVNFLKPQLK